MPPEDADLLRASAAGDGAAFTELMRRHEDKVFSIALRILGNRSDALDATQDTFVTIFRKASTFRGEAAFSTWLYRIALNTCRDLLRRRARTVPLETSEAERSSQPTTPSHETSAGNRLDLSRALVALSPEYREAVLLHDLAGVPYDEIARRTGVAVGTVKSRISRGRRKLAELMEPPEGRGASKERDGKS